MADIYAIGATALTGGGSGALDAVYVDAVGDDPGIADRYVAIVFVQGDAVYHYIADADSGLDEDSPDVIKPDWQSEGVAYDGALRWILTNIRPLPTGAEIKALYEAEANTNAFTDAEKSKLSGIETGADVTDAVNIASSIHGVSGKTTPVDADEVGLIDSAASNVLKKLTWANLKATLKTYFDTLYNLYVLEAHASNHTDGTDDIQDATAAQKGLATATQIAKLDGIEEGATADQTGAEIKSLYEAEEDTNAYTDAEKSKLAGIEEGADVTDAANVAAAGAVMESDRGYVAVVDEDRINTELTTDFIVAFTILNAPREYQISSADIAVAGRRFIIKDESGSAGTYNITISTEGVETIDGAASITIHNDNGARTLYSNGTNLSII